MKKLELNQMENLNGGVSNRGCMLMGGLTVISWCFGPVAGLAATMYTVAECA